MPENNGFKAGGALLNELVQSALKNNLSCVVGGYELKSYARAFGDGDLVETCMCLIENDLNVSRTAGKLYMHRNTLIYRIAKLKRLTGLDISTFEGAASFIILYGYYRAEVKNK